MSTSEWPTKIRPHGAPFVVRQVEYLKANDVEVEVFHFRGGGNPLNYWRAQKEFKKIEQSFNPDIVHAQWGQSVLPTLPKQKPLVITYRGDDLEGVVNKNGKYGIKSFILKRVGRYVAKFANQRIVVSPHLIQKLPAKYRSAIVMPSGIESTIMPKESKEFLRQKWSFPEGKKVVLFPNNPDDPRKNIQLLKDAIALLSTEDQKLLELKVIYGVTHPEILEQLKASDFLFFTSMHEGSPNVVKEAIALDVPVISVPVGDVPYRIGDIPGCFLTETYKAEDFANAIKSTLSYDYEGYSSKVYVEPIEEAKLNLKLREIYKSILQN